MNVRLMLKINKRGEEYMKKQQHTRVRLKASVKEMLKQNPMQAINIKSISAASHISRTSFYANFENMDDLIYELHDDFISGIGDIYKKDLDTACHPVSQSTLMAVSEYIHSNQSLIQFLLHEEGLDLFMKRTYLRNIKFITQFFKLSGIDISQQKKHQLKIILIGCVHSIYQDLPECKTEDIYITLKNAYSLFFDFILDRAS